MMSTCTVFVLGCLWLPSVCSKCSGSDWPPLSFSLRLIEFFDSVYSCLLLRSSSPCAVWWKGQQACVKLANLICWIILLQSHRFHKTCKILKSAETWPKVLGPRVNQYTNVQTSCGLQFVSRTMCRESFMRSVFMAELLHSNHTSSISAMQSVGTEV